MSWRQPTYNFKLIIDDYTEYEINEPQGFKDLQSLIYRDLRVHGCFYEMTPADFPLAFDGIAKDLLRDAFDADGVDSETSVSFLVEKDLTGTADCSNIYGDNIEIDIPGSYGAAVTTDDTYLGQTYTFTENINIISYSHYFEANVGSPSYDVIGQIYKVNDSDVPYGSPLAETGTLTPVESDYLVATFNQELEAGRYACVFKIYNYTPDGGNYIVIAFADATEGVLKTENFVVKTPVVGYWVTNGTNFNTKSALIYQESEGCYDQEFRGNIDFSSAKEDDKYFYCSVLRSDLLVDVLNNRDMEVQLNDTLDVFGDAAISNTLKSVSLHSFKIRKKWEGTKRSEGSYESETDTDDAYLMFGYDVIGTDEIDESQDITYQMKTILTGDNTEAIWLADLVEGYITISMNWDVELYHYIENTDVGSQTFEHQIYLEALIYDSGDNLLDTMTFLTVEQSTGALDPGPPDNSSTLSGNYTGSASFEYDSLADGDYIVVYWRYGTDNYAAGCTNEYRFQPNDWDLTIEIDTIEPASTANGYLVFDALEDCLRRITGLDYPLESDFFNTTGCGYLNILTNGWKIRKFDEPVTGSFSQLFRSLSTIFGLGYGVEQQNKVKVELWEYFYQDQELLDLGDVGDYEENVMGEEIFNQVILGFRNYANDEDLINSKEDFHTEGAWATPIRSA